MQRRGKGQTCQQAGQHRLGIGHEKSGEQHADQQAGVKPRRNSQHPPTGELEQIREGFSLEKGVPERQGQQHAREHEKGADPHRTGHHEGLDGFDEVGLGIAVEALREVMKYHHQAGQGADPIGPGKRVDRNARANRTDALPKVQCAEIQPRPGAAAQIHPSSNLARAEQKHQQRRKRGQRQTHRPRRTRELGAAHGLNDHVGIGVAQDGQHPGVVVPHGYKGQQRQRNQHRTGQRQHHAGEDTPLRGPVHTGGLEQGARHRGGEVLAHQKHSKGASGGRNPHRSSLVGPVQHHHHQHGGNGAEQRGKEHHADHCGVELGPPPELEKGKRVARQARADHHPDGSETADINAVPHGVPEVGNLSKQGCQVELERVAGAQVHALRRARAGGVEQQHGDGKQGRHQTQGQQQFEQQPRAERKADGRLVALGVGAALEVGEVAPDERVQHQDHANQTQEKHHRHFAR